METLPLFTVIVTFPAFLAVIFPDELTEAIDLLDDEYVTDCCDVTGVNTGLIVYVFVPLRRSVTFVLLTLRAVVLIVPFCTFTLQLAFAPLFIVTAILQEPTFLPFTLPVVALIARIDLFEQVHLDTESPDN